MSAGTKRSNRPPKLEEPMVWVSSADRTPSVSAAWITRPRVGETESGDTVIVRRHGSGVLVVVVDALGHGPRAADVARTSTAWLDTAPSTAGAPGIVQGLHRALHGSRGAAALVMHLSASGIEACSVGNVELRSITGRLPFVLTPGVLGVRLRSPKVSFVESPAAERFVLFSDGISGRFDLKSLRSHSPPEVASHIFASHRHAHDDATVVVVDVA